MKIVWSPLALERVREITDYISQDNLEAARILAFEIISTVERLERFPESGRIVPETGRKNLREIIHGKYRIIYRLDPHQVSVLTVRHTRQSLPLDEIKPA